MASVKVEKKRKIGKIDPVVNSGREMEGGC